MADLLAGIEAKLDRAAEHVEEFDADCRTFLKGEPWSIDQQFDEDSGCHIGYFRVRCDPPLKLGVIAAEVVGQCRSALDHLIAIAVRLDHSGVAEPPPFPIQYSGQAWGDTDRPRLRPLLRDGQLAAIERLQPCKGKSWPRADQLRRIQAIDNIEKHDHLIPAYIEASALWRERMPDPDLVAMCGPPSALSDLTDGAKLYAVRFRDEADVYVPFRLYVEIGVRVPVTKKLPAFVLPLATLRAILDYTRAVVQDFRDATPEFRA